MEGIDINLLIALGGALLVAVLVVVVALRWERSKAELNARLAQMAEAQANAQAQLAQRLLDQERAMGERLERVGERVGQSLHQSTESTKSTLSALGERLAVMDKAQQNITELSNQMVSLQDILSNKQTRGAFGEIQLKDIVAEVMPAASYQFQAPIGDGKRVDCLLKLPNPPGPIAIDAKFPLESYNRLQAATNDAERVQAARQFSTDVRKHVLDIREKYVVPGETADAAVMFLPSEAVYAELHANYGNVVEESFRHRVFIASPQTLWALLNTIRGVFRDVRMREQAHIIQKELHTMIADVTRLMERVGKLDTHFQQANKDIEQIKTSATKITRHAEKIQELELDDAPQSAEPIPDGRAQTG